MVYDPYAVLGVSYKDSDEDIKKAYRTLSRRYHPDSNINNPNKAQAEEKFKLVQQAYDQIMKDREQGVRGAYGSQSGNASSSSSAGYDYREPFGGSSGFYYGPFGFGFRSSGFQSSQSQSSSPYDAEEQAHLDSVSNYLNNGYYREAWILLQSIPAKNAYWYYLAALTNSGLGNNISALQYARRAAQMEPTNLQYLSLLQQLQVGGSWYESRSSGYGRGDLNASACGKACMTYSLCTCVCCGSGASRFLCCC